MKLRQLECFDAVITAGTMTAAAQQLKTSQPGVSNLIAVLEREIGFALFHRSNGRLIPTPEARHFHQIAKRIVADMEDARQQAKLIAQGKHGQLTIATLPGLGLTVIPSVITMLQQQRPDTRFKILTRSTDAVRMMIPSEQCDVAIVETPVDSYAGQTEILSFECVAVLSEQHKLATASSITPELLADQRLFSLNPEHATTQQLQRAFFDSRIAWSPHVEARLFATCCEMVVQSDGVSIVDPMTAAQYANCGIVIRPFVPRVVFEVALILPGTGPYAVLAEDFVSAMKDTVQDYNDAHCNIGNLRNSCVSQGNTRANTLAEFGQETIKLIRQLQ